MAYILTPNFAPVYQAPQCNPFGFCAPAPQPTYAYRTVSRPQPRRPSYSPYSNFFSQVGDLLGEIDREAQRQAHLQAQLEAQREAQREAHRQRQQRKRALRAKFAVTPSEQGWQVDAEVTGFAQENINIEITDENTLKVAGNTEWRSEPTVEAAPTPEATEDAVVQTSDDRMDGVTLNETETETETETEPARSATPDSDTRSHRSYQPTVEDDFEDLGAETSSLISTPSESSTPAEPKGKEKAVEEPRNTETAVTQQPQPEVPVPQQQQQQQEEEARPQGSFERTFRFPQRIDASNVKASFKDGILHIAVPRAQPQQVRRIAIL